MIGCKYLGACAYPEPFHRRGGQAIGSDGCAGREAESRDDHDRICEGRFGARWNEPQYCGLALGTKELPSEMRVSQTWRTRLDPFEEDWSSVVKQLREESG